MNVNNFLSKIWAEVKGLFKEMPADLQHAAAVAVTVVENIKTVVNNPAVDLLSAIIPGNLDNKVIAILRTVLPVILSDLTLLKAAQPGNPKETVQAAVSVIQNLKDDVKKAFLHDLGILIAQEVAKAEGGQFNWTDAVYIVEWYYQHEFKQKK